MLHLLSVSDDATFPFMFIVPVGRCCGCASVACAHKHIMSAELRAKPERARRLDYLSLIHI